MQRHHQTQALLLKSDALGETHRLGTFLSADLGLFRATFFGARSPNSRLGALAVPFQHLELWLYHQPVKNYWKVTDAREILPLDGLRQDLERYLAACLWAELALYSHAEGDWAASYQHLAEALTLLNSWPPSEVRPLNIQFCLRWVAFLGYPVTFHDAKSDKIGEKKHIIVEPESLGALIRSPLGEYPPVNNPALVEDRIFQYLEEVLGRTLLTLKSWRQAHGAQRPKGDANDLNEKKEGAAT